ncbi:MAG: hypothetical protein R2824_13885 [Saprospiraceae bacterium]
MRELTCLMVILCWSVVNLSGQQKLKKHFRLPPALTEVSGLYYAGTDSLWWHNDGGDQPALYLTDGAGNLKRTVRLPALHNQDWEDITADDQGRIYIGEFGNNANRRKDLRIYRYDPGDGALDSISFVYPDQHEFPPPPARANYDMEAFFWFNDSLHLFSKNRLQQGNYQTRHYTLPASPGTYTAQLRDSLFLRKRVITGAAISPDRKKVALIGYNYKRCLGFIPTSAASIFLFTDFTGSDFLRGTMKRKSLSCIVATQYEAVDFIDNSKVYVASEKTAFIPPRVKRKRVGKKQKVLE